MGPWAQGTVGAAGGELSLPPIPICHPTSNKSLCVFIRCSCRAVSPILRRSVSPAGFAWVSRCELNTHGRGLRGSSEPRPRGIPSWEIPGAVCSVDLSGISVTGETEQRQGLNLQESSGSRCLTVNNSSVPVTPEGRRGEVWGAWQAVHLHWVLPSWEPISRYLRNWLHGGLCEAELSALINSLLSGCEHPPSEPGSSASVGHKPRAQQAAPCPTARH